MSLRSLKNLFIKPRPETPGTPEATEINVLNRVDLCFVVDTTGSMGSFIGEAKRHLVAALETLRTDANLDLHTGLVEYRDHPPQEKSFVTRIHPLTGDPKAMQKVIAGLKPDGGGDMPEAVYDGLQDTSTKMTWRPHSLRLALLVGDAPPHGMKAHEGEKGGKPCLCGLTLHSVTASAEGAGVTVMAVAMSAHAATVEAFTAIARGTGGECMVSQKAGTIIETMNKMLAKEFGNLPFDAQTLEAARAAGTADTQQIADTLHTPRGVVAASLARLGKRGLLEKLNSEMSLT
jgi:hypothetical protein